MDFLGIFNYKFDFLKISLFHTTMDQLCEPIEVNRKFIKMIETIIKPQYEIQLNDIFSLLKQDIDEKYKPIKLENKNT